MTQISSNTPSEFFVIHGYFAIRLSAINKVEWHSPKDKNIPRESLMMSIETNDGKKYQVALAAGEKLLKVLGIEMPHPIDEQNAAYAEIKRLDALGPGLGSLRNMGPGY